MVPELVQRTLAARSTNVSLEEVVERMDTIAEEFRDVIVRGFADTDRECNPHHQPSTSVERAQEHVACLWRDLTSKLRCVPGKRYGRRLSAWAQEEYGVSLGPAVLAREMWEEEFDDQLAEVLAAIEELRPFPQSVAPPTGTANRQ